MSDLGKNNRPTGRTYSSVHEMMKGEKVSPEVQSRFAEIQSETQLVDLLAKLRLLAGLTQEEMGNRLGIGQSAVSKLEAGRDEDLEIKVIREYCKTVPEQRLVICFGKPMSNVEAVKWHAHGIRTHLEDLAKMAHQYEEMRGAIQGFFGEAFFNILDILSRCQNQLPQVAAAESEMRVHLVAGQSRLQPRVEVVAGEEG